MSNYRHAQLWYRVQGNRRKALYKKEKSQSQVVLILLSSHSPFCRPFGAQWKLKIAANCVNNTWNKKQNYRIIERKLGYLNIPTIYHFLLATINTHKQKLIFFPNLFVLCCLCFLHAVIATFQVACIVGAIEKIIKSFAQCRRISIYTKDRGTSGWQGGSAPRRRRTYRQECVGVLRVGCDRFLPWRALVSCALSCETTKFRNKTNENRAARFKHVQQ